MKNPPITTHILNTALGKPATGIDLALWILKEGEWTKLSSAVTNEDGRIDGWSESDWFEDKSAEQLFATYKLVFELDSYWEKQGIDAFYPSAEICFKVQDTKHYHIPLLLSPFAYSTYRGS
ncbi:hydroxyisourate hydrolase [Psychromonas aquatilis]|uniref:5-hydroxyisourate hydrolase n=1 Tax=Psychromonas aquatilis TaxID=2005072 RepID=A0ABU9GLM2_9GAMM